MAVAELTKIADPMTEAMAMAASMAARTHHKYNNNYTTMPMTTLTPTTMRITPKRKMTRRTTGARMAAAAVATATADLRIHHPASLLVLHNVGIAANVVFVIHAGVLSAVPSCEVCRHRGQSRP